MALRAIICVLGAIFVLMGSCTLAAAGLGDGDPVLIVIALAIAVGGVWAISRAWQRAGGRSSSPNESAITFLNVLGTLLGLAFVLGGGCTILFWGAMLFEGDTMGMAVPLIVIGLLVGWAGVALIRAIWRKRAPPA